MSKGNVLVIDDELNIRNMLQDILVDEGFTAFTADCWDKAYKILISERIDAILLDIWLPNVGGMEILTKVKTEFINVEVIMISGHGKIELAVKAIKEGAFEFLEKPLSIERTIQLVNSAITLKNLKEENENLRAYFKEDVKMIGVSPAINKIREQINSASGSDARVLITGENGTGKELIARAIHLNSSRKDKPFIEVNCAAIPENLIESELFGYEKGAFTNAINQKKGKFELGNRGSIFLDEVADMSLSTQAKLLRVLQEMKFERVGGVKTIQIDARIISATNKSISQLITENLFREDLFYRLNVIPIHVPSLRERREDIPHLIEYFLERFSMESGRRKKEIDKDAIVHLTNYDWPGNIRELKNVIERLSIMTTTNQILMDDLLTYLPEKALSSKGNSDVEPKEDSKNKKFIRNIRNYVKDHKPLKDVRDFFEREYIIKSLADNNMNISNTAKCLEIERSYLHKKIKDYDIKIDRGN